MDDELLYKRYEHSAKVRGAILEATVELERLIEDFISIHFCSNVIQQNEFKEMLLSTERITLSSKKDILFMVLDLYHKDFKVENPTFLTRMDSIAGHRNIFAHLEIDKSENENIPYQIIFKKYKNGKYKPVKYGKVEIENLHAEFIFLIDCLENLITSKAP